MSEKISFIPSRVKNCAEGGHVAGARDIIDDGSGITLDELVGNKKYDSANFSGMGRIILKKNIVNDVNTLTQDMFKKGEVGSRVPNTNTIYVIQYDFTLGEDITIPANCILEFDGGSISAGTGTSLFGTSIQNLLGKVVLDNVIIDSKEVKCSWYKTISNTLFQNIINNANKIIVDKDIVLSDSIIVSNIYSDTIVTKTIVGQNNAKIVFSPSSNSQCLFEFRQGYYFSLSNITFTLDNANYSSITYLKFGAAHIHNINNCTFYGADYAIKSEIACFVSVLNCTFNSQGTSAIYIDNESNAWKIDNCVFNGFLKGNSDYVLNIKHSRGITVHHCWSENNTIPFVYIDQQCGDIIIDSCWIEHLLNNNDEPLIIGNNVSSYNNGNIIIRNNDLVSLHSPVIDINYNNINVENNRIYIYDNLAFDFKKSRNVYLKNNAKNGPDSEDLYPNYINGITVFEDGNVKKAYNTSLFNNSPNSSFAGTTTTFIADDGNTTIENIHTEGVYDNSCMKIGVTSSSTNIRSKYVVGTSDTGRYFKVQFYAWTDSLTPISLAIQISGQVEFDLNRVTLSNKPQLVTYYYKYTGTNVGNEHIYLHLSKGSYNIFIDDIMSFTSMSEIGDMDYIYNPTDDWAAAIYNHRDWVFNGKNWKRNGSAEKGTTRPTNPSTGDIFIDESLTPPRPIWYMGTTWVDATGATV